MIFVINNQWLIMSKDSEMEVQEQRNEEQELYQSDEVVWGKVKGYPWWPGYVREVYDQNSEGQMEYEVHFFGDNTQYLSSKLGQSKIRKFLFKYRQFYKSAKVNRKLKLSIQKAEEKLKENNQNVEVFENLRTEMRGKQRGRKPGCQTDSKVDSSEHNNNAFDTPQLSKLANQIPGRIKTHQARIQKIPSENQIPGGQQRSPANGNQPRIQQQSPSQQEQKREGILQKIEKSAQSIKISKIRNRRKPRGRRPKVRKSSPVRDQSSESSQSQKKQQQKEQSKQSIKLVQQQVNQQLSSSSSEQQDLKIERGGNFRKRGRGRGTRRKRRGIIRKAIYSDPQQSQQPEEQEEQAPQIPEFPEKREGKTKRRGRKKNVQNTAMSRQQDRSNQNIDNSILNIQQLSQNVKESIMERLNFCIENREELIETLGKIPITIENVKQILDLGVVDIVKEGQITNESRFLLEFLKAVLLFKYFPQDGKIKKKYEKALKKKAAKNRSQQKKTQEEYTLSNEDLQIRKKTIIKLEKIIRGQNPQKSKQLAHKMEFEFRKRDPSIGDQYKKFAYNILRSIKDKKQSIQEVLQKIQNDGY